MSWTFRWMILALASLVFASVAIRISIAAAHPEQPTRILQPRKILEKGDRLAKERKIEEALEHWKEAYLLLIPGYRDLAFRHPVPARYMDRESLGEYIRKDFEEEYPEEEVDAERITYSHLGFYPRTLDVKALLLQLLTEEIAGFYDPDKKSLFLIREEPAPEQEKKKGFFSKLFGDEDEFDPDAEKSVLAHELAHALSDQHHDLLSLSRSVEEDDDMMLALEALVEGEAMLVMFLDPYEEDLGREFLDLSPLAVGMIRFAARIATPFSGGDAFQKTPLVYREQLLFPYLEGLSFCLHLTRTGKWDSINATFARPPLSTEQILHPEKFHPDGDAPHGGEPDEPVAITFEREIPLDPDTWRLVRANTLGELTIGLLLRTSLGKSFALDAAEGWDGDRYRLYRRDGPDGPDTLFAWVTTWDTQQDAREFADALVARFGDDADPYESGVAASAIRAWESGSTVSGVWRSEEDVIFLDRVPRESLDALLAWSRAHRKAPKEFAFERHAASVEFPSPGDDR